MHYVISNTQSVLSAPETKGTRSITPVVSAFWGSKGGWTTILEKALRFRTRSAAIKKLNKANMIEGRNEYPDANRLNEIDILEIA